MQRIEAAALDYLDEVEGKVTVRQVFYALVYGRVIPKHLPGKKQPSQYVSEVLDDLRWQGVVPFGRIVDRTRGSIRPPTYRSIAEGLDDYIDFVEIDPWEGPSPQLWVEKETVAGVVDDIAADYRIPLITGRGQFSLSYLWTVAAHLTADTKILYVGDFDKGGFDIQNDAVRRATVLESVHNERGVVPLLDVTRLAITREQIDQYDLDVESRPDKRTKKSYEAVEVEALPQPVLRQTIIDALEATGVDIAGTRTIEEEQRADVRRLLA